jgi:hypothetical protein
VRHLFSPIKKNSLGSLLALTVAFTSSCSLSQRNHDLKNPSPAGTSTPRPVRELIGQTRKLELQDFEAQAPDAAAVRTRIQRFSGVLKKRGAQLSPSDWKLHDALLQDYAQLKAHHHAPSSLTIPPKRRAQIRLRSFCLDSGSASPATREPYRWKDQLSARIPYLREILNRAARTGGWRASSTKGLSQERIQELLWNLENMTNWEEYPEDLKSFLISIDPKAALKLPSGLRSTVLSALQDQVTSALPGLVPAQSAYEIARGRYHHYQDFRARVESLRSKYPLPSVPTEDLAEPVEDSGLYATTEHPEGYRSSDVTLYNPTERPLTIDLSKYFLEPQRKDVQPLALVVDSPQEDPALELELELEKVLYEDMARLGIGFTPGLNDVADAYELLFGRDFVSNRPLSFSDRMLSGLGLIAGSGAGYRWAERALLAPASHTARFEAEFGRVASKSIELAEAETRGASRAASEVRQLREGVEASPTLREQFEQPEFSKTDFIVRENGDVIPATAYRYIDSEVPYLEKLRKTGKVPSNPKGTYLSFERFESSEVARNKLQLSPPDNNARYRLDLETGPIAERLEIPNGDFGRANYLEPVTKDFPQFGEGGATQAVTRDPFRVNRIIDLKDGSIIYESAKP